MRKRKRILVKPKVATSKGELKNYQEKTNIDAINVGDYTGNGISVFMVSEISGDGVIAARNIMI